MSENFVKFEKSQHENLNRRTTITTYPVKISQVESVEDNICRPYHHLRKIKTSFLEHSQLKYLCSKNKKNIRYRMKST